MCRRSCAVHMGRRHKWQRYHLSFVTFTALLAWSAGDVWVLMYCTRIGLRSESRRCHLLPVTFTAHLASWAGDEYVRMCCMHRDEVRAA